MYNVLIYYFKLNTFNIMFHDYFTIYKLPIFELVFECN